MQRLCERISHGSHGRSFLPSISALTGHIHLSPLPSLFIVPRRSMGILDRFQGQQKDDAFQKQINSMLEVKVFSLDHLLHEIKESTKFAGVSGLRSKLPWVKNRPETKELDYQIRILEAFTPEERADVKLRSITPMTKIRIAKDAGVDVSDINRLLMTFEHAKTFHYELHKLRDSGKPLPTTVDEAQVAFARRPTPSMRSGKRKFRMR